MVGSLARGEERLLASLNVKRVSNMAKKQLNYDRKQAERFIEKQYQEEARERKTTRIPFIDDSAIRFELLEAQKQMMKEVMEEREKEADKNKWVYQEELKALKQKEAEAREEFEREKTRQRLTKWAADQAVQERQRMEYAQNQARARLEARRENKQYGYTKWLDTEATWNTDGEKKAESVESLSERVQLLEALARKLTEELEMWKDKVEELEEQLKNSVVIPLTPDVVGTGRRKFRSEEEN